MKLWSDFDNASHLRINFRILSEKETYQNTMVFLNDETVSCNKLVIWFLFPELDSLPAFSYDPTCAVILPDLNKMEWEVEMEKYFGKIMDADPFNSVIIDTHWEESSSDPLNDKDHNIINKYIEFSDPLYDKDNNVIEKDGVKSASFDYGDLQNFKNDIRKERITNAIKGHFGNIIPVVKGEVSKDDLRVSRSHEKVLKECEICQQISRKRGGIFKRHVLSDHPLLTYFACDSCDFIAFTNSKLKTHFQRIHVESTVASCPKCGIEKKNLRNHIKHCNGESKPEIKMKGQNYEDFIQVQDGTFNCLHCGKKFPSWQKIYAHVYHSINTDQIKLKTDDPNSSSGYKMRCKKCFLLFQTSKSLFHHERTAHSWTKEERECVYCTQEFKSISLKKNHERRHVTTTIEKTKDHQCTVCVKRFYTSNALKSHMDYHRQTRDFECRECGNKYKSKSTLSNHIKRVHDQILSYCCGECGKRFYSRGDCEKHEIIHDTTAKTLPCPTCGKLFRRKNDVKKHSRIHSNIKPFGCKFCDKTFNQTPNMWVHMKKHHPSELAAENEIQQGDPVKMEVLDPDYHNREIMVNELAPNPIEVAVELNIKKEEDIKNEIAFNG